MRLTDFLDKGASLGAEAPCLTTAGRTLTYFDVQRLSWRVARALDSSGIAPGDKVAILSANDPVAFSCVFGISRAGAVWCPVNPRNEAAENRDLLDFFDCTCLIFQAAFAPLVAKILPDLPKLTTLVCLDGEPPNATPFDLWIGSEPAEPWQAEPLDDIVMVVGTGGTTGRPKGVMLTGHNIETMSALTLMSYPFRPRPRYLALAPLTHALGQPLGIRAVAVIRQQPGALRLVVHHQRQVDQIGPLRAAHAATTKSWPSRYMSSGSNRSGCSHQMTRFPWPAQ